MKALGLRALVRNPVLIDFKYLPSLSVELFCNLIGPFEIKEAIQRIFKVKVIKVNTSIMRGKLKSFKGSVGYKKDFKKAIVTLAEGNTIDSSLGIK